MINLIQKGVTYKQGEVFPLVTLPLESKGEEKEFNDFQWWGPTSKWNEWLKSNPDRKWQAESVEYLDSDRKIYEFFVKRKEINPEVLSFDDFSSLLEAEGEQAVQMDGGDSPASPEKQKNFTKFLFAYNKLIESGKLKTTLDTSSLGKGSEYAIVGDLPNSSGTPIVETRSAWKMKISAELPNGYLAFCDEAIPYGKFPAESSSGGGDGANAVGEIAKLGAQIAASGVLTTAVVGAGIWGAKKLVYNPVAGFFKRKGEAAAVDALVGQGGKEAAKQAAKQGAGWLSRLWNKEVFRIGGRQVAAGAGEQAAAQAAGQAARQVGTQAAGQAARQAGMWTATTTAEIGTTAATTAAETGTALGAETALASSATLGAETAGTTVAGGVGVTVGAIAIAVVAAGMIIQRLVNWNSDNQAPTYSDLEDAGATWMKDVFLPGTIPAGEDITICWTQSSGNGFWSDLLFNADTRTTMDLIKLGNFKGRSVFLLVQINSKEYDAVLKSKEIVLITFDENQKFDTSWYDNDDLEFEMISIDKGEQNLVSSLIFQGYCSWDEMESEYKGADDTFIGVPDNAPDEYSFYFKYGKSNREINVTGSLARNIDSLEGLKSSFKFAESSNESEEVLYYDRLIEGLAEESGVLSFSQFSSESGKFLPTFEAEDDQENQGGGEGNEYFTKTLKLAVYDVKKMEYADLALQGQELPNLESFIIPNNYLEAADQEDIQVDPIQEIFVNDPKKGTVIVESDTTPEPVSAEAPGITGGVEVQAPTAELVQTYRDRPEILNKLGIKDVNKITDKDKKDEVNILDFITPEEREKLGLSDWDFIRKVKVYKDAKTGEPILVKFKTGLQKKKIKASDENFDVALKVANRIQAGFDQEGEENEEKQPQEQQTSRN